MADTKISALPASTTPLAGTEVLPIVQSGATKQVSVANLTAGRAIAASGITNTGSANLGASATNVTAGGYTTKVSGMSITTNGTTWLGSYGGVILDSNTQYSSGARRWGLFSGVNITNFGIARSTSATTDPVLGGNAGTMSSGVLDFEIDTSGNVKVNTGNLVIGTSGKGIDFSAASHAAGMTSELLDDYEEGTFTPTIVGTTSAGAGTYSEQNGYYTKVGNRVYVNIALAWSAHTGTGNMRISGLPFTNENVTGNLAIPSFWVADLALTAGNVIQGFVNTNGTQILLYQVPTGGGASTLVPIDTAATLRVSLQYQTAS